MGVLQSLGEYCCCPICLRTSLLDSLSLAYFYIRVSVHCLRLGTPSHAALRQTGQVRSGLLVY